MLGRKYAALITAQSFWGVSLTRVEGNLIPGASLAHEASLDNALGRHNDLWLIMISLIFHPLCLSLLAMSSANGFSRAWKMLNLIH